MTQDRTCSATSRAAGQDGRCPIRRAPGSPIQRATTLRGPGSFSTTSRESCGSATVDAGSYTWSEAQALCTSLRSAAPRTGDCPRRIELLSLLDTTRASPAIDPVTFPGTPSSIFWTTSSAYQSTGTYRYVRLWFRGPANRWWTCCTGCAACALPRRRRRCPITTIPFTLHRPERHRL